MIGALLLGYFLGSPTIEVRESTPYIPPRRSKKEIAEQRKHDEHLKKCRSCRQKETLSEMEYVFW